MARPKDRNEKKQGEQFIAIDPLKIAGPEGTEIPNKPGNWSSVKDKQRGTKAKEDLLTGLIEKIADANETKKSLIINRK